MVRTIDVIMLRLKVKGLLDRSDCLDGSVARLMAGRPPTKRLVELRPHHLPGSAAEKVQPQQRR